MIAVTNLSIRAGTFALTGLSFLVPAGKLCGPHGQDRLRQNHAA